MVSHRSGETEDNFIADLSVGLASGQVGWLISLFSAILCYLLFLFYGL